MRAPNGLLLYNAQRLSSVRAPGSKTSLIATRNNASGGFTTTRRCLSLMPEDINSYSASQPPTEEQLKDASRFFTKQEPILLFSSPTFRALPASSHPEVTFLGRSNVGKSSLINALFNRHNMAYTSKKPGKTRLMHAYGVSPNPLSAAKKSGTKADLMESAWKRMRGGLLLVDMPGYGHASRANWGEEISKYLRQRKQLQRVFMLVDSDHGLKSTDKAMLERLVADGVQHSIVFSKVDKLFDANGRDMTAVKLGNKARKVKDAVEAMKLQLSSEVYRGRSMAGDVLCVSSRTRLEDNGRNETIGLGALRHAVMSACGLVSGTGLSKGLNIDDIQIIDDPQPIAGAGI